MLDLRTTDELLSREPWIIMGGTYDPVHIGHLRVAQEVAEALDGVVHLMPAGNPPHRAAPRTPALQRLAMVQRAVAGNPRLRAEGREAHQAGASYTVDTLEALRAEHGPQRPLVLVVGGDALAGLPSWHRWTELTRLAHLLVVSRPGWDPDAVLATTPALRDWWRPAETDWAQHPAGFCLVLPVTPLDISATHVRRLRAQQKSVRYLVTEPVLEYIESHQLYLQPPPADGKT